MDLTFAKTALPVIAAALLTLVPTGEPRTGDDPTAPISTREAAAAIDRLVNQDLVRAGLQPNRRADDATFARRAYQTISGRVATAAETEAFVKDRAQDKRARLVDALLASPGLI